MQASPSSLHPALAAFRRELAAISAFSTIGLTTAQGVSSKNAALERLAWRISDLATPDDQIVALKDVLRESATLPEDQHAHVIATIIHDLVMPRRIVLHADIQPAIGEILFSEGLAVVPNLVPEGIAYNVLRWHLTRLVEREQHAFDDDVYDRLDEIGFNHPAVEAHSAAEAGQSALHQAAWLERCIRELDHQAQGAHTLTDLINGLAALPVELRASLLPSLINHFTCFVADPTQALALRRQRDLVTGLPPSLAITSLEAYYNQLYLVPHGLARTLHPDILAAVQALPVLSTPVWFERSRRDLIDVLERQGQALQQADFDPDESLLDYEDRMIRHKKPEGTPLFGAMDSSRPA